MITAKTAGFCFGVKKAVGTVYELAEKAGRTPAGLPAAGARDGQADLADYQPGRRGTLAGEAGEDKAALTVSPNVPFDIVTYGPIIHNEVVVEDLRKKGVGVITTPEEISSHAKGTIVIRSHGVSRQLYDTIKNSGARVVDTTCTFVKRIHEIVAMDSAAGAQVVIIGNHGHAEVEGHKGWCKDPVHHPAIVIETKEEAQIAPLALEVPVSVVAQTTFHEQRFTELVGILQKRGFQLKVHNTICNATRERQEEARKIAAKVDVMLVIGGKSSSNTAKLYDICRSVCPHTMLIQTVQDLIPAHTTRQTVQDLIPAPTTGQTVQGLTSVQTTGQVMQGIGPARTAGQGKPAETGQAFLTSANVDSANAGRLPDLSEGRRDKAGKVRSPKKIGITAGASTPKIIIEEVQSYVRGADF